MSWVRDYQDDLLALEKARADIFPVDLSDDAQTKNLLNDFNTILGPLQDGSLNTGDIDEVLDLWWQKFSNAEIAAAQKEAAIQHRLAPLYMRLEHGTEEDWEEYSKILLRARFQSRTTQGFLVA